MKDKGREKRICRCATFDSSIKQDPPVNTQKVSYRYKRERY